MQANPFLQKNTPFQFTSTPFIKLNHMEPSWKGPIFEELASTMHGKPNVPPGAPAASIPDTGGASSSTIDHAPVGRRKVINSKTKSRGTRFALPAFNPVQGTADMQPSGSNLAGIGQGMVEPNASGAMPNPAPAHGMVTGYRSTKTQLKIRRHSTKRPEPKAKTSECL